MLSRREIQSALRADRVVELSIRHVHGPLGLEQLAAELGRLRKGHYTAASAVQRPISLPTEAWEKLSGIARRMDPDGDRRINAGDVAASMIIQCIDAVES